MIGNIVIAVSIGVVFAILLTGLYVMFKGGSTAATWSNRLMRLRVLAQFVAILVILAVFYFTGHH